MKHISVIIAENRIEALNAGKEYEKKCEHCGFPIWTVDEEELRTNHLVEVRFRGMVKRTILCSSCMSTINDILYEK